VFVRCLLLAISVVFPQLGYSASTHDIAILKSADITAYNQAVETFKAAMPDSKFVAYDLQGDLERGYKLAKKIRATNADLVLAVGIKAALAAKREIPDIPIVYSMVLDPQKNGLTADNMVGITLEVPVERQFREMRSVLPGLKRVGVLYDPEKTGDLVDEARRQARNVGIELIGRQLRSEKEVPAATRSLIPEIEALWLIPDSTVLTEESINFLLSAALESNRPIIGFSSELVRNGALIGLSVNYEDIGRQAAGIARKIFNGQLKAPAVFPPEKLRLALNVKTGKFLGIAIPADVVNRADQLY
jgi:putative ABC transport system substrate-binding protein